MIAEKTRFDVNTLITSKAPLPIVASISKA
jgi:hypothetical protein